MARIPLSYPSHAITFVEIKERVREPKIRSSCMITAQTTSWSAVVLLHPHAQTHADRSRMPRAGDLVTAVLFRLFELVQHVLKDG